MVHRSLYQKYKRYRSAHHDGNREEGPEITAGSIVGVSGDEWSNSSAGALKDVQGAENGSVRCHAEGRAREHGHCQHPAPHTESHNNRIDVRQEHGGSGPDAHQYEYTQCSDTKTKGRCFCWRYFVTEPPKEEHADGTDNAVRTEAGSGNARRETEVRQVGIDALE